MCIKSSKCLVLKFHFRFVHKFAFFFGYLPHGKQQPLKPKPHQARVGFWDPEQTQILDLKNTSDPVIWVNYLIFH